MTVDFTCGLRHERLSARFAFSRALRNQKRIELERRKQEIEREKDELKQFYSEAFECSTHSVNHDPNFLQLLDDVVVSIILPIITGRGLSKNSIHIILRVVKVNFHQLVL